MKWLMETFVIQAGDLVRPLSGLPEGYEFVVVCTMKDGMVESTVPELTKPCIEFVKLSAVEFDVAFNKLQTCRSCRVGDTVRPWREYKDLAKRYKGVVDDKHTGYVTIIRVEDGHILETLPNIINEREPINHFTNVDTLPYEMNFSM
jgi:hypothetical protein